MLYEVITGNTGTKIVIVLNIRSTEPERLRAIFPTAKRFFKHVGGTGSTAVDIIFISANHNHVAADFV